MNSSLIASANRRQDITTLELTEGGLPETWS
jgi:hypothetical protein